MKNNQVKMGMKVKTLVPKIAYYQEAKIPVGSIGRIGAKNVPYPMILGSFNCVDFLIDGKMVRGSYKSSEIEIAQI